MIHTKVKCPVCGDVIQEGRTDYFCRSYAFGRNCRFCVSRTKNIITQISGQPLNYPEFIKLLQPAGLTVPVRDKRYQFQIVTEKNREWEITSSLTEKVINMIVYGYKKNEIDKKI